MVCRFLPAEFGPNDREGNQSKLEDIALAQSRKSLFHSPNAKPKCPPEALVSGHKDAKVTKQRKYACILTWLLTPMTDASSQPSIIITTETSTLSSGIKLPEPGSTRSQGLLTCWPESVGFALTKQTVRDKIWKNKRLVFLFFFSFWEPWTSNWTTRFRYSSK